MVKERGAEGAIFQADVTKPDQITRLFNEVREKFPSLDIFVSNARPEAVDFFYPPAEITLDQWMLLSIRKLPWVAMGSAKAAMESLVRYFAVAFARRGIAVNAISPGWTEDSVLIRCPNRCKN
jgi:enoyl-[acyl-carrier protein] reductase III